VEREKCLRQAILRDLKRLASNTKHLLFFGWHGFIELVPR
jgi:hypothetical protein